MTFRHPFAAKSLANYGSDARTELYVDSELTVAAVAAGSLDAEWRVVQLLQSVLGLDPTDIQALLRELGENEHAYLRAVELVAHGFAKQQGLFTAA